MRKSNINSYLLTIIVILLGGFNAVGQDKPIPESPENLRTLPVNFKDDYTGEKYNYTEHLSFLDRLKAWFIDFISSWFNLGSKNAYTTFQTLKFIFYLAIIIAVIYYLVKLLVNKEGRWLFGKNPETNQEINLEEVQNIKEADFKELIQNAEIEEDYRSAVKFYYLLVLKKMDIAEKINYDSQKTTHDYLLHLEGTNYHKPFSKIAYYFTYIWYGEFNIDKNEYHTATTTFVELLNQFNND